MKSFFLFSIKIAAILAGLSAGLSLSHVLEIPGKHSLTELEFVHVHHTFYGGYAIFGSIAWIFCSVTGLIAGFNFYKINRQVSVYSFIASATFIICIAIFILFLNHYNQLIAQWDSILPPDWESVRNRWELGHTMVFVFNTISFILFLNVYGIVKLNHFKIQTT
jgi:hypothetical protein